ncbi:unnamed protein product [Peronospora effusa]|nr:unnamed protein product [Peronospora effusa]
MATMASETHELRQEIANSSREKKKDAVKKMIAKRTLKKLVDLYWIDYGKSNPDLTILAMTKDAADSNPLIRALSVSTMGCIRVDCITEYLCEPRRRCLKDEDPYVRKTTRPFVVPSSMTLFLTW